MLETSSPFELRQKITQASVRPGELLWQGTKRGFCIAASAAVRKEGQDVAVLTLQEGPVVTFKAPFVIPVSALLNEDALPRNTELAEHHRQEIDLLIEDVISRF